MSNDDDYDFDKVREAIKCLTPEQRKAVGDWVEAALKDDGIEGKQVPETEMAAQMGISVQQLRVLHAAGMFGESVTRHGDPWPEGVPLPPLPKEH